MRSRELHEPGGQRVRTLAYYSLGSGGWRDWWVLLHPPYTAWHLSYVVMGAALAPVFDLGRLAVTVLAFALAVGVGAHVLDELHGRPLMTDISTPALYVAAGLSLTAAVILGVGGVLRVGIGLLPFIGVGVCLVLAYNLELFGGRIHTDLPANPLVVTISRRLEEQNESA